MLLVNDKSPQWYRIVMLVEIPDPDVIFWVIVAFLLGLGGFYAYYKIRPYVDLRRADADPGQLERLEYYERQLIDMKIRLDALEFGGPVVKTPEGQEPEQDAGVIKDDHPPIIEKSVKGVPVQPQRLPNMTTNDAVNYVLRLITDKAMTSRDIQITLGRSREHTSRLMKRLFEDGYVHRNVSIKPYTYSITGKGREKINSVPEPVTTT